MKTEAIPQIDDVMDHVKGRFIALARGNETEPSRDLGADIASLMVGEPVDGDPTNTLIDLISYAHGLHEGAKTHRQLGSLREAEHFHEIAQALLSIAADNVVGVIANLANMVGEKQ